MRQFLLPMAFLAIAHPAQAGQSGGSNIKLSKVGLDNSLIWVESPDILNPTNCSISGRALLPTDAAVNDRFLSMALTAISSGAPIEIWVEGCTTTSSGTMPQIYYMSISK